MDLKTCQQTLFRAIDPYVTRQSFQTACQLINSSADMNSGQRLLVYRHSITSAQQRVLAMIYPVCQQVLGEDCFNTLARDYAWYPKSNAPDLNAYGQFFTDLLAKQIQHHVTLQDYPYLADLAKLEWAWHQALFAADDPEFTPQSLPILIEQYQGELIPQTSHSLYLITTPWPVYTLWQKHQENKQPAHLSSLEQSEYLVIYRQETVTVESVSYAEYGLLALSRQGLCLDDIALRLKEDAETAMAQLPELIRKGCITGFAPSQRKNVI